MKQYLGDCVEQFLHLLMPFLLALMGGVAHGLNRPKENFTWWGFLTGLIVAGFVGVVVYYLLQDLHVSENFKSATIAISGYSADKVLMMVKLKLVRFLDKFCNGDD